MVIFLVFQSLVVPRLCSSAMTGLVYLPALYVMELYIVTVLLVKMNHSDVPLVMLDNRVSTLSRNLDSKKTFILYCLNRMVIHVELNLD